MLSTRPVIPAANSLPMPPSPARASARGRASACGPRDTRRRAFIATTISTQAARALVALLLSWGRAFQLVSAHSTDSLPGPSERVRGQGDAYR
jgi:hypothetical protein